MIDTDSVANIYLITVINAIWYGCYRLEANLGSLART